MYRIRFAIISWIDKLNKRAILKQLVTLPKAQAFGGKVVESLLHLIGVDIKECVLQLPLMKAAMTQSECIGAKKSTK